MPEIELIRTAMPLGRLTALAEGLFGDLVKAVVDAGRQEDGFLVCACSSPPTAMIRCSG